MNESIGESLPLTSVLRCENCAAENPETQKFCSACSFPINGSETEKTSFRLILSSRKRFLADAEEKLSSGKLAIYVLAGLFFISGLFVFFANDDVVTLIVNLIVSLVYLTLAAWFPKNPFGAMLTALILYGSIQVINLIIDPATIFQGWLIKIFVIAAFVKGIRSALDAKALLAELAKLNGQGRGAN